MKTQHDRLVIVDGVRTPFCRMGTDLNLVPPDDLGRVAVQALLARTGIDPGLVDEVIFGCVGQPAESANIARIISLRSGIPEQVPAMTVHRNCASGFESITTAHQRMVAGQGSVFVVGGTESMSRIPLMYSETAARKFAKLAKSKSWIPKLGALTSFRWSDFTPRVGLQLGLTDPVCGLNMGETAEVLAREFFITRDEQDCFALESHAKAVAAAERLREETVPVFAHSMTVTQDNGPRSGQTIEALSQLKPVFDRRTGTVTAGNASQITDGAAALLVMSESRAEELGFKPLGVLAGYAYSGCDPMRMGLGPVYAMAKMEKQLGLKLEDADLIELNEAFAAQALAVIKASGSDKFARKMLGRHHALGLMDRSRVNVNGGAIALGHPVGATGTRLVLTSLMELRRRNAKRALATLCVGGGQGGALWLEVL